MEIISSGKTENQAGLLFNRLVKRFRHLRKWAKRIETNAFRLYDRDIPEIPLVLDLYEDAVSGAFFKRPFDTDDEVWLEAMRTSISRVIGINENHIFLKERRQMKQRQNTASQYAKISTKGFYRDVRETDLTFRVNLSDYLDTGLFLDARKKRALIRAESEGKRVLNLFAYTGSLSVCAAKGGARQVDSVDLSKTYLDWGKINFAVNGLGESDSYSFIQSDVGAFLNQAAKKNKRWDIIILDPPSFSNSKKTKYTLDIRRDYIGLVHKCLALLDSGGALWFSSNAKGLKVDSTAFPGFTIKDMGKELVDEDFRGKRMPVCCKLTASLRSL